jgi:hypothetical protein
MECIPRRNQPRIRKTGNSKIKIEKLLSRGAPEAEANGGRAVVVSSQGHCMLCPANILGALLPMHLAPCGVRRLAAAVCGLGSPRPLLVRPRRHSFLSVGAQQEGPPGRRLVEPGGSVAPGAIAWRCLATYDFEYLPFSAFSAPLRWIDLLRGLNFPLPPRAPRPLPSPPAVC